MSIRLRFLHVLTLIPLIAFATQPQDSHSGGRSAQDPDWTELMGDMYRMHSAMASLAPSGDPDVNFVKLMLPHHQGAIDMAKSELLYGKDPQMRRLAQEIITDQQSEIQLMQLWWNQHQSVPSKTR